MKSFNIQFYLVVLYVMTLGCGGGRNPDLEFINNISATQKIGATKFIVLDGADFLKIENGVIEGTGIILFAEPLHKVESAHNFAIEFELSTEGSVTLIVNADQQLKNGIEFEISKSNLNSHLQVIVKAGSDSIDLSSSFKSIDSSSVIQLAFDVHNDHGDLAHIIAWDDIAKKELLNDILQGKGFGSNWGMKLNQAKVNNIKKSKPRDEH